MREPHAIIDVPSEDIITAPAGSASRADAPINSAGAKLRIPGNRVMDAIRDLPQEQADPLWWFYKYCKDHDFGREEMGRLLKKPNGVDFYTWDSISQTLSGGRIRRGENIQPMVDAIIAFRKVEQVREEQANSGFIETRLFFEIEKRCLKALHRQRISYIFGDSQIGKTESLKEVQRRHNHGQTVYIEVPSGGSLGAFLRELAEILKVPEGHSITRLKSVIIGMFNSRMLLLVDEAHRCFNSKVKAGGSSILDFIRELYNKARCGVVISMTYEGQEEMLRGRYKKTYEQMWRRRIAPLSLPNVSFRDDLDRFAKAYGLPPAPDEDITIKVAFTDNDGTERTKSHSDNPLHLQTSVNKSDGLGIWISILQDASDMAKEKRKPISWGAVIKAYTLAQADAEILN